MKITEVKVTLINWEQEAWATGMGGGSGTMFGGDILLGVLTIETDEGITGNAFLGSPYKGADDYVGPLVKFLKPIVMGRDPMERGAIWWEMWRENRRVTTEAIGAIDVALWDIAGKASGLPIHQLIGTCRYSVPAYSSTAWHATAEEYAEEAKFFQSLGWTAHKIHPHADPTSDIEICRAVRETVGEDMVLMLDSMWAYSYEDAVRVGRAIEELNFFWYEDPLCEEDIYNYVKLRQKLDIPIMSTEFAPGRFYGMANWIQSYATDILRGDVAVSGGITPLIKIAHLAEGFGMKFEIHHGGNSLNNVADLHVTMSIRNCDYYEVFPCSGAAKYALVQDIEVDDKGLVYAPTEPGLGYEIDWDLVKHNFVQEVS